MTGSSLAWLRVQDTKFSAQVAALESEVRALKAANADLARDNKACYCQLRAKDKQLEAAAREVDHARQTELHNKVCVRPGGCVLPVLLVGPTYRLTHAHRHAPCTHVYTHTLSRTHTHTHTHTHTTQPPAHARTHARTRTLTEKMYTVSLQEKRLKTYGLIVIFSFQSAHPLGQATDKTC